MKIKKIRRVRKVAWTKLDFIEECKARLAFSVALRKRLSDIAAILELFEQGKKSISCNEIHSIYKLAKSPMDLKDREALEP